MRKFIILILLVPGLQMMGQEQLFEANPLLATTGNMAGVDCIDDDFSQTIFFAVPVRFASNFYLRVWDPDCGGENDLSVGLWETNTQFEVYGGKGCFSEHDARLPDPAGNYKSGDLLVREIFGKESEVDGTWVTFGPFSVGKGEKIDEYPGYAFFKTIVEGRTGNDTNLYSLFLSSSDKANVPVEDVTFFCYESACWKKNGITILRSEDTGATDKTIFIPVKLKPQNLKEFGIIAEPVDD